ncbi:MAG: pyridoxamine 5'-phosphate oxidase family protein [Ruminococcaceae bacterium]|nr:pyridoxamine 5'-phosphate oxidase family protein [Oscillospiraceae bacterium]
MFIKRTCIMNNDVEKILDQKFGYDNLISVATVDENTPYVRTVNSYYENGAFYTITHALTKKMKQIEKNPKVAICSNDWFCGHGIGENIGHICDEKNAELASKLRAVFAEWYDNGHTNENDPNTCILKIRLTDAVLYCDGKKYDINFNV